jgi:hypothetical protein
MIEFEKTTKAGYKNALKNFKNIDSRFNPFPDLLGQAVCYYVLGNERKAVTLATLKPSRVDAYKRIIDRAEFKYSVSFVNALQELVAKIGTSFFDR